MRPDHLRLVAASICEVCDEGRLCERGKAAILEISRIFHTPANDTRIKTGCLGAVGTHFRNGQRGCTVVPAMYVVCHQETKSVLSHLVKAMKKTL